VYVVTMGEEAARAGRSLVRDLREAGLGADLTVEDRPMKAQMRQADRSGAPFAAIIGEQEVADGEVTMRRMADGEQERVKLAEVPGWLRSR
jgi:histidyl-tRNA synthetase